jgi:hypothetical protein
MPEYPVRGYRLPERQRATSWVARAARASGRVPSLCPAPLGSRRAGLFVFAKPQPKPLICNTPGFGKECAQASDFP